MAEVFPSFATAVVTRVRPFMTERNGRQIPDWGAPPIAEDDIPGWSMQPGVSDESLLNRTSSIVRWTGYGPEDADIQVGDGVRYRGVLYQVDGEPARWPSPTGGLDHTVILLIDHQG